MHDTAEICAAAARRLLDPGAPAAPEVRDFLDWLGCPVPDSPGPVERNRALLLRATTRFDRLFSLDCPTAPGLAVFGAEVPLDLLAPTGPAAGLGLASASGTGAGLLEAFEGCVGEGIELLSSVATAADRIIADPPRRDCTDWLELILPPGTVPDGWVEVARLDRSGASAWLPAGLCLRRAASDFVPPWPLSIGCAAGRTPTDAALHALLELIERDAAALWWRGGRRGRPVPLEDPSMAAAVALLAGLRQGATERVSWLLDLTTDLGVPVLAAISTAADGRGLCCGLAARTTRAGAARAAVLEMAQMEMAHAVVLAKQAERGRAALNTRDLALLARHDGIDAGTCGLLHPQGIAPRRPDLPLAPEAAMPALLARLAGHGFAAYGLDLTRPAFGVPVVRIICPGLEVEPSRSIGPRLRQQRDRCGSADCQTPGIGLM